MSFVLFLFLCLKLKEKVVSLAYNIFYIKSLFASVFVYILL